ncbi:hypothetical protein KAR91_21250 [Candidatus Pacearchaeota archaeon]|nr:hypothetical protein [Candidatus Pacearchaeota archaeon]
MITYWLDGKGVVGKQFQFANLDCRQLKSTLKFLKGWGYKPISKDNKNRRWPSSALRVHEYNFGRNFSR